MLEFGGLETRAGRELKYRTVLRAPERLVGRAGKGSGTVAAVEETILRVIGDHLGLPGGTLKLGMALERDLGADSLDRLELIMTVEEIFHVTIDEASAVRVATIGDVVALIKDRRDDDQTGVAASQTGNGEYP